MTFAAGKIPGGFFQARGRPNEREILICRIIDRSIRPLFSQGIQLRDAAHRKRCSPSTGSTTPTWRPCWEPRRPADLEHSPSNGPIAGVRIGRIGRQTRPPTPPRWRAANLGHVHRGAQRWSRARAEKPYDVNLVMLERRRQGNWARKDVVQGINLALESMRPRHGAAG